VRREIVNGKEPLVKVGDVGRAFDQPEIPVGLKGPELRRPKEAQRARLRLAGPLEDFDDPGMSLTRIPLATPLPDGDRQPLVE